MAGAAPWPVCRRSVWAALKSTPRSPARSKGNPPASAGAFGRRDRCCDEAIGSLASRRLRPAKPGWPGPARPIAPPQQVRVTRSAIAAPLPSLRYFGTKAA
jgi:hypothetical protein